VGPRTGLDDSPPNVIRVLINVKISLCSIKLRAMKMYGRVDAKLRTGL
jgi:hypothetical protein